jgi:probable F420-dependent oxidoreductase
MHGMKFGVNLPTFRYGAEPTVEHSRSSAQAAERLGFDSVWAGDHIMVPAEAKRMNFFSEPLITLAVVAGQTKKLLLGTSVVIAPLRNPLVLAKQAATLDYLSQGRLILGLGGGWLKAEFDYVGIDYTLRGALFDETLRLLRAAWSGVPVEFEGQFFQFKDAVLEPQPHRPGGPPLWIGGGSARALRRTAELGDAWHADDTPAPEIAKAATTLAELGERYGRKVEVTTRLTTRILKPGDGAASEGRGPGYYRSGDAYAGIVGTPDELLPQVQEFADACSSHFIAQFEHKTVEEHIEAMEIFAEAVIARMRAHA